MASNTQSASVVPEIAIIGGGASGTLTAVQLLRQAALSRLPLRLTLIDRDGRHGQGRAYATGHPDHLLNAVAGQMSAFPDEPDHLVQWADITNDAFLPRCRYGEYLQNSLADAERQAPWARLSRIRDEVLAIRCNQAGKPLRLTLADGRLYADVAVLALGGVPPRLPFPAPASSRIITDPWAPQALDAVTDSSSVVIVGTGLTMIDLVATITEQSRPPVIYAISRHGMLPRPHPGTVPTGRPICLPATAGTPGPVRLTELMRQIRAATSASPTRWPDVIDAIRPFVPGLWRRMPDRDKQLFLRHVSRYWEVHRHLIPPSTARQLAAWRHAGQLSILQGQIVEIAATGDQLKLRAVLEDNATAGDAGQVSRDLTVGWLINGTGAGGDVGATDDPLMRDLFATGTARPDTLGLGLAATGDGAILDTSGTASETLYTLGPPLRGLWYETTAVPEIRQQADALARRIIGHCHVNRRPGSAA